MASFVYQAISLPPLYHWSPPSARNGIVRRGLRPTCATATANLPDIPEKYKGAHFEEEDEMYFFNAVCLGTSPFHAWALSGDISAEHGEVWDLWEVRLGDDDLVFFHPVRGYALDEIRVANHIPKSRVLWVAERRVTRTLVNPVSRKNLTRRTDEC